MPRALWLGAAVALRGMGGVKAAETLDFGNAGTGTRLMMGVVGGHAIQATFDGDASLRKRPMRRIIDPVIEIGAAAVRIDQRGLRDLKEFCAVWDANLRDQGFVAAALAVPA